MAVIEVEESIFVSPSQSLVVPVNIVGAMGAGLALAFRNRVPGLYENYRVLCFGKRFKINNLWRYPWVGTGKQVICFPTKQHWSMDSDKNVVINNLYKLVELRERLQIESLAIPPVGCGLGGLSYQNDLREEMIDILSVMGCDVRITLRK